MKKILLVMTFVVALALPSTASADEWYIGDLPAEGAPLVKIVDGSFDIDQEGWNWHFRCEDVTGLIHSTGSYFASENCSPQGSSPPCQGMRIHFQSNPLIPYGGEETYVEADPTVTYIEFGKNCQPNYPKWWAFNSTLYIPWDNETEQLKFNKTPLQYGATMNGEVQADAGEGNYLVEVGEEEYENVFGHVPLSIR